MEDDKYNMVIWYNKMIWVAAETEKCDARSEKVSAESEKVADDLGNVRNY